MTMTMTAEMTQRLHEVMQVQSYSGQEKKMRTFIKKVLKELGVDYYQKDGNIYATKGKADVYPCQVSHTDTVHRIIKDRDFKVVHDTEYDLMYAMDMGRLEQTGIGGDDKVGIFICLELLRSNDVMKAAFFCEEETGCVGSGRADMSFFKDCGYALQCDRKGDKDFTESIMGTVLFGNDFGMAINGVLEKHKRKLVDGGLTDVFQLTENGMGIACANMSCGYYSPHSDSEWIYLPEVFETLELCQDIYDVANGIRWEHEQPKRSFGGYGGRYGRDFDDWNYSFHGPSTSGKKRKGKSNDLVGEAIGDYKECPSCHSTDVLYDVYESDTWCYQCELYIKESMIHPMDEDLVETHEDLAARIGSFHEGTVTPEGQVYSYYDESGKESHYIIEDEEVVVIPNDWTAETLRLSSEELAISLKQLTKYIADYPEAKWGAADPRDMDKVRMTITKIKGDANWTAQYPEGDKIPF